MTNWVLKGLKTGIKSTAYPRSHETAPGISPGRPCGGERKDQGERRYAEISCPTGALSRAGESVSVNHRHCIHCLRCRRTPSGPYDWEPGYEWGESVSEKEALGRTFSGSLHIRIVDAGACVACLSELRQITNPYYNIHRLGFFITPTPRTADVLLVAGPGTDHMRGPLKKAYDSMPGPKRVIAVGTCALTGGIFGPSFAAHAGVGEIIPVDVEIPGCPPPPLAVIHALLVTVGRKNSPGVQTRLQGHGKGEKS